MWACAAPASPRSQVQEEEIWEGRAVADVSETTICCWRITALRRPLVCACASAARGGNLLARQQTPHSSYPANARRLAGEHPAWGFLLSILRKRDESGGGAWSTSYLSTRAPTITRRKRCATPGRHTLSRSIAVLICPR